MSLVAAIGQSATISAQAVTAPVGEGFTVTTSDLAFILKQIKIAEAHVANTTSVTGPCGALIGTGPNQIPDALTSYGLRTVDGSCNNLLAGRETYGASDQKFPRYTTPVFNDADPVPAGFGPAGPTSYKQKSGNVFDSKPRDISNLIVDQTSTNPAAVAAAGFPVRTQGNVGVHPCTTDPDPLPNPPVAGVPAGCVPSHDTLFIPNVTTDVGLSPPYNSMFTLFGQFFDHGVDQTVKSGGNVFVPLHADDPLVAGPDHISGNADDLPASQRFMVLTRAQNQPGPDGVLGDNPATPTDESADDVQEALNTDSPYVDQSQTYTSHPSHQVFVREYVKNTEGKPVSTGKLLGGAAGTNAANGMATWETVKTQAETLLGLHLTDKDVLNVPMIATDPYGKFILGPDRGLPQYVTSTGMVEGDTTNPVPVPANVKYFDTPFLTDIAHNADPSPQDTDHNPGTPPVTPVPDDDKVASADFASQAPGTYDDEMLDAHFIAGDGRVNENIGLTTIHQIFHSEHDRLVDDFKNTLTNDTSVTGIAALAEWKLASGTTDGWNGERLFQAARFVTEMEYQHLVFEEFARKVQPAVQPFHVYHTDVNGAIHAEFAHAVYRFGHSMLTETIARTNPDGTDNSIPLLNGFLNPPAFTDDGHGNQLTSQQAAGAVVMGMSDQTGNELDEFVTDTLRNNLLGLPLDLATINMTRAREAGVPPLNEVRRQLHDSTGDGQLAPYTSWADFGQNIKHPESLINFVAAYGTYPTIANATTLADKRAAAKAIVDPGPGATPPTAEMIDFMNSSGAWAGQETGLNKVDLWVGGLAEKTNLFGGLLGSTFNYVFENQLTDLQNGDRLYYLARTPGMNLRTQLEGNSFSEMIMRNTDGVNTLKADVFATADCKFQLGNLAGTPDGFTASGPSVADDTTTTDCNENALLLRKPDGTIQYQEKNTVDPSGINGQSVYNGTDSPDRVTGGNDNDTFWGNAGNDVMEGNGGDDVALGGDGNDRITDLSGADVLKGGPGNDYVNAGIGDDITMGGDGQDFMNGGANDNETFAGPGNDFVRAGDGADAVFGDGGDDWIQGGSGQDLLQGDHGAPFFDDPAQTKPGNDIMVGQVGENDYDAEGGDDLMASNAAIDRFAGAAGFDWAIHQYDTVGANDDMKINQNLGGLPLQIVVNRDRWQETEANSGSAFDDVIKGDDRAPSTVGGAGFSGCDVLDQAGIDRIAGLGAVLPAPSTPLDPIAAASAMGTCPLEGPVWGDGNILLGGLGSDRLEGRGADDVIDGDRYVQVRISVRSNPSDPASEIGSTDLMEHTYRPDSTHTLEADVAAGLIDPGNLVAVREVITPTAAQTSGNTDTAVFSGPAANYTVATTGGDGTLGSPGSTTTVTDNVGTDGTDTLRNIEALAFSDTVLPGAPVIGTATAGNARATVTWTAPTVGIASSFSVKVLDVTTNPAGVQVGNLLPAAGTDTSLVVPGLTNGNKYVFQVSATNAQGTGPFSVASNVVTPAPTAELAAADAPTAVTARAGDGTATLTWTAPVSDGGSPITGFRVRAFNGAAVAVTQQVTGNVTTAVVTGLANGTAYTFDVAAVNAAGTGAASAASAPVTPAPAAVAPAAAGSVRAVAGNALVTLSWSAPASNGGAQITGYEVRTFIGTGTTPVRTTTVGTGTGAVVAGLINATGYTFDVAAINAVGTGARSARTAITTPRSEFVAPTITSRNPAPGATSVSQATNLTVTFSEPVTNMSTRTVVLRLGTAVVPAAVTYNNATRIVTVNPSANLLADRTYSLAFSSIRDTAGNTMAPASWQFTAGPAPTLVAVSPASGARGVARTANVAARFSEPITGVSTRTVVLRLGTTVISAAVSYNSTTRTVTLNPSQTLAANRTYTVLVSSIRDMAGNPFVSRSWTFTTGTR
ncbi:peroxidase family protein [Arthrobacter globiformis]|uniref:Heme peroxidase n=1 Tax=Arthrobacter globiformis TaxID=1665 RepID=A0A328HGD7_ARTGO|nr:peroxidase family protein [Arthrobacter globiformis]RAM37191.1 heme peroxidase [Arthrobacter globiformis]